MDNIATKPSAGAWLIDTYWYVPPAYLPALNAINTTEPVVVSLTDQTVWHIVSLSGGYVTGISATNIGRGWSYMLIVGSVLADGSVRFSFSALGAAGSDDSAAPSMTIGTGVLRIEGGGPLFAMQMTSGTAASSVTHWAHMLPLTSADPAWLSLPGYPDTGVPDLTGLQTPIH